MAMIDDVKAIGNSVNKEMGYEAKFPSWYDTVFGAWRVRKEMSKKFRRLDGIEFYTPPVTMYLINPNDVLYSFKKNDGIKAMKSYMEKNGKKVKIKGELKSEPYKDAYKVGKYYYIPNSDYTYYNVYGSSKMKGLMQLKKENNMSENQRMKELAGIQEVTKYQSQKFDVEYKLALSITKEISSMLKKIKTEHDKETAEDDWAHVTRLYKINDGLRKAWSHLKYTRIEDERRNLD